MGRIQRNGVERSADVPGAREAERLTVGMASPYAGIALSPAGREAVLDALRAAWTRNPELRFCQLLVNATGREDPFYVEDGELLALLRKYPGVNS